MNDREMLLMAYGAMKAVAAKGSNYNSLDLIVILIEEHLYPPTVVNREAPEEADSFASL